MRSIIGVSLVCFLFLVSSCKKEERSSATGWKYNDQEWGGFEKLEFEGQATGPNLVLIQGGTFSMGQSEEDVTYEWDNVQRRVTVSSFYMDETEVANIDYREYIYWLKRVYGESFPQIHVEALPDSLVWREELAFNEPYIETYFRFPAYDNYPVVGVNWNQASDFAEWRTDRVNEMMLIEKGILNPNPDQKDAENFNTKAYLAGQYQPSVRKNLEDKKTGGERNVKFEDGIMLPSYRLPIESEWEYAALALQGNQVNTKDEIITDNKIYPWNGAGARFKKNGKQQGEMLANFKRSRGDYMGVAGKLNDNASIPAEVRAFWPNDFGLYNMAGNVSEWTADIYRPTTSQTLRDAENHDLNPYRGGKFKQLVVDENGAPIEKDELGRLQYEMVEDSLVSDRENYKKADVRNYLDGDDESVRYEYGVHTLINDESRVIKGGSWADRLFWLSPGTRRFKNENLGSRTIGFRCAMVRTGGATGNEDTGGNFFKRKGKTQKRRYK